MDTKQTKEESQKNIIEMFGIDKLPKEEQEKELAEIGDMLFEEILIKTIPLLKEKDLKEYEKLIDSGVEPDELMNFFFDTVPNFAQIINQEAETFRKESEFVLKQVKN
ncbi:MAG: DUF5663 domain-containing protein [Candidatus Nomurabacteria bacterium]|nr:DUF5663 domain-containing protein [Candidatus Nomurabacteria bacterium]